MLYACRFNPAPWYVDHWQDDWPEHEPRTPNWNMTTEQRAGHHGAPGDNALLTDEASDVITGIFKNRWRTLMSVDDVVAAVIAEVDSLGLSDCTYFFCESLEPLALYFARTQQTRVDVHAV